MKKAFSQLHFAAVLIGFGVMSSAFAANHEVQMKSISFAPKKIQIAVGDTITWKNVSYTDHNALAEDKSFETGLVPPQKASKAVSFPKAGTYSYQCSIHGKSMSGVIEVGATASKTNAAPVAK